MAPLDISSLNDTYRARIGPQQFTSKPAGIEYNYGFEAVAEHVPLPVDFSSFVPLSVVSSAVSRDFVTLKRRILPGYGQKLDR